MSTMNFSIPDDVKDAFNEAFKDENKSAIITKLMQRAIEDRQRQLKSDEFIERLHEIRSRSPGATAEEIRKAREEGRH